MSGHEGPAPVADISAESFPEYGHTIQDGYVEGYDPVSLSAPHSSLVQHSTWIGMGLLLASLAGMGIIIFGVAGGLWGRGASPDTSQTLVIVGAVVTAICALGGFGSIRFGRRNYRSYKKQTGRRN